MLPYVRSILRDEFGRESTIGVSNPTTFGEAESRAKVRLNKLLGEHGLEVTSIVTPRPRFSKEYEDLIEARNQAENQLAVIDSELQRAKTERDRKLAEVERDQNKVIQTKRAELEAELATAVTTQTQTHREVDAYKIDKVAAGEAERSGATRPGRAAQGRAVRRVLGQAGRDRRVPQPAGRARDAAARRAPQGRDDRDPAVQGRRQPETRAAREHRR